MDNRICAQLYNIRDFCQTKEGLDGSLAKLQKIGYKTVQISGVGADITAEEIKEITDKYGMEIMLTHTPAARYENDIDGVIKDHHTMNCKIAGLGGTDQATRSSEGIKRFVEKYSKIADKLYENGLVFAYHNHAFDFVKLSDGKTLIDYIIENTDPEKFKIVADLYWSAFAGVDPVKFLKKLGDRAIVCHYKDLKCKPDNTVTMCEVGQGNLDWDEIIEFNRKSKTVCAAVELDVSERDQFESYEMSYNFLKTKGFI
ncbi:MAG: sugar phosphate isomerase/epimerase [Clostridia bacterium]|nr:sugar phosphate isomerase/epimerase [Clostridia bacterium]